MTIHTFSSNACPVVQDVTPAFFSQKESKEQILNKKLYISDSEVSSLGKALCSLTKPKIQGRVGGKMAFEELLPHTSVSDKYNYIVGK